jgi:hypothetical protein
MTAAAIRPPSVVPYNSNEGAGAFMEERKIGIHVLSSV